MTGEETLTGETLILESIGKLPAAKFRLRADGAVEFRYLVEDSNYPGFDGNWRMMSETERREHMHMGGRIAEWLKAAAKECGHK